MAEPLFQVGLRRPLRATHVMPGVEGPEGSPHEHDYVVEVVVGRRWLEDGMVLDLDLLEQALARVLEVIDGEDLEVIRPLEEGAVTVEVLARWIHDTLAPPISRLGGEAIDVRVWETEYAFGGYSAPLIPPR